MLTISRPPNAGNAGAGFALDSRTVECIVLQRQVGGYSRGCESSNSRGMAASDQVVPES